jgi:hypothetical protein
MGKGLPGVRRQAGLTIGLNHGAWIGALYSLAPPAGARPGSRPRRAAAAAARPKGRQQRATPVTGKTAAARRVEGGGGRAVMVCRSILAWRCNATTPSWIFGGQEERRQAS